MQPTIDSAVVGTPIPGLKRRVDWRHTTNYAAAVGDLNPRYLDDRRSGGVVAPPLFAVAVTWPLISGMASQLGDAVPAAVLPTMVHASEHLILHRPVRPGDTLEVGGEVMAAHASRAGTRLVVRLDAFDGRGEPVFTEYTGAVFRGVGLAGEPRGLESLPVLDRPDDSAEPAWIDTVDVPPQAPYLYDGCTDIVFAIHTSPAFAAMVGLPGILLQGTAALAMAAGRVLDHETDGDPARLGQIAVRFGGMLLPGRPLQVVAGGRRRDDGTIAVGFEVRDDTGRPALRDGLAVLSTP